MTSRAEILKAANKEKVRFLRLQFTDLMGTLKNVEVPRSQFEKALDGQIMFDGSSIEGFVRIEESDMLLIPDYNTFQVNPWANPDGSKVGETDLRRLPARRLTLRGLPASGAPATDRSGEEEALQDGRWP